MTTIDADRGPAVGPESIAEFWRTGWLVVPGVFGEPELTTWRAESDRLMAFAGGERGAVPNADSRPDRVDPVIDLSSVLAGLAADPRVTGLAAAVLGGDVQLFKDKLIAKPPGARGYGHHQDLAYWPVLGIKGDNVLTVVICVDGADTDTGAIECTRGQHGSLLTEPGVVADPDESQLGEFEVVEAAAGDVMLLHSLTPHRSAPNGSDRMRRQLFFTYAVEGSPDVYGRYQLLRKTL